MLSASVVKQTVQDNKMLLDHSFRRISSEWNSFFFFSAHSADTPSHTLSYTHYHTPHISFQFHIHCPAVPLYYFSTELSWACRQSFLSVEPSCLSLPSDRLPGRGGPIDWSRNLLPPLSCHSGLPDFGWLFSWLLLPCSGLVWTPFWSHYPC